jgi:hypothetical protein
MMTYLECSLKEFVELKLGCHVESEDQTLDDLGCDDIFSLLFDVADNYGFGDRIDGDELTESNYYADLILFVEQYIK